MGYSENTIWTPASGDYDVFYGRSFDESGIEEHNRLILRKYLRRTYTSPDNWLEDLIEDCIYDVGQGKRILLNRTPGFYNQGDNFRFFVPFEKNIQAKIKQAIDKLSKKETSN